jgi:hypothetical protein
MNYGRLGTSLVSSTVKVFGSAESLCTTVYKERSSARERCQRCRQASNSVILEQPLLLSITLKFEGRSYFGVSAAITGLPVEAAPTRRALP